MKNEKWKFSQNVLFYPLLTAPWTEQLILSALKLEQKTHYHLHSNELKTLNPILTALSDLQTKMKIANWYNSNTSLQWP